MLEAALKAGLLQCSSSLLLKEAMLPTGVPDLIAVKARSKQKLSQRRLTVGHLRILQFLSEAGPHPENDIVRLLNYPERTVRHYVIALHSAKLISKRAGVVALRPMAQVFATREIIAIEAKIHAWRSALRQASANLWFASQSYILIPALKCLHTIIPEAKRMGVGVLVFDGKSIKSVSPPRKQSIPASYGSWLINEWAVGQLV